MEILNLTTNNRTHYKNERVPFDPYSFFNTDQMVHAYYHILQHNKLLILLIIKIKIL
jgi:hypothetical protein